MRSRYRASQFQNQRQRPNVGFALNKVTITVEFVRKNPQRQDFHTLWPGDPLVGVLFTDFSPFDFRGSFKFAGKRAIKHLLRRVLAKTWTLQYMTLK
jgi:hypothetical protein